MSSGGRARYNVLASSSVTGVAKSTQSSSPVVQMLNDRASERARDRERERERERERDIERYDKMERANEIDYRENEER